MHQLITLYHSNQVFAISAIDWTDNDGDDDIPYNFRVKNDLISTYQNQLFGVGNQRWKTWKCWLVSIRISCWSTWISYTLIRPTWSGSTWSGDSWQASGIKRRWRRLAKVVDAEERRQEAHGQVSGRHLHTRTIFAFSVFIQRTVEVLAKRTQVYKLS